ncbi:redox-regulated ATPase YchF [Candidatus Roizmanbacteria bacterium RIFCSPHIGHO2_02_FULL_37_15]|uniref:Redox-regulated ATPase YchF n=1 Tax=Candidatus Roizmanbacteria bacterium RIFCSPLOWO2_01_FULL_37_16 TaxID=1802058 RepID=A0A1F7IMH0_9BACT|nr:MAG: redox-regulated ATPase YchF [Candidatus Roizmanbacteria bacterium RIFCSPHIGHO2_01_FULL_37_16b]OGK21658.1 MAG: redox-regulated ATPase YchF [Candidatus Roizmanbacteria bacterium RIFCSPHIGHO2_02_FULL_37_15]OGK33269.1 MAG: redox-regulated ATPase YchF [Candidatus Roizmanbacteria bacterium RIFCSPHIGHO2_12_FULL_36_11]OGK44500.1 MAG: redox-regulated ATPase YchF [Candidatus Roizmanbacteria bacterium RIFCSPLOWO2_01_FULL_37_16]
MSLKIGIIGLPNAGKSTLFNALVTKPKAGVAAHPFTTIDKNIGVVEIPDDSLFQLAKIENIGKVTTATITFVDIAGLIKGAHQGEGLGNQFLHHIREVDLILHVVRFFKNESIPHVHSKIDPEEDIEIVNEELLLADLQTLEKRLDKEKSTPDERAMLKIIIDKLNQGVQASEIKLEDKDKAFVKAFNLLTLKKQLLVANIDEDEMTDSPKKIAGSEVLSIGARFEADLNEYKWVEQQKILKDLGLKKTAKEQVIKAAYHALDTITFYTIAKRKEARAWLVKRNSTAIEAAAKIHSDFAKYFVKVEQINAQELIKIGSWLKAHEQGKVLLHGKDYLVQNADVLEFKVAVK